MELSEKERFILMQKKQELQVITNKAIDIVNSEKNEKDEVELKKCITNMLSIINMIGSYANSKNVNLDAFSNFANLIFMSARVSHLSNESWGIVKLMVEVFCNDVNSIRFNFTKKTLKIIIPKINLSLFKT
jgi:hypothetical protein